MKKVLLYLYVSLIGLPIVGQPLVDKFSLQIGAAGHGINRLAEAGTLSLAFHPSYEVSKKWSINLRYDLHILQFGNRQRQILNWPFYQVQETYLRNFSSLTLIPQFHSTKLKTHSSFGLGFGYFQKGEILNRVYSYPEDKLVETQRTERIGFYGLSFIASAYYENLNSGIILNYFGGAKNINWINGYASAFLNYDLFGKKKKEIPDVVESNNKKIPIIMIEAGIQPMSNLGEFAGAFNIYFEPKVAISKTIAIGIRINSKHPIGVGYDDDPTPYYFGDQLNGFLNLKWNDTQTMEKVYSRLLTGNYYFPKNNGWYFLNSGLGFYHRNSSDEIEVLDFDRQPFIIPAILRKKNIGGFLGAGFKIGGFRISLEYNFTGKNIPDYLATQMGLELNFFK